MKVTREICESNRKWIRAIDEKVDDHGDRILTMETTKKNTGLFIKWVLAIPSLVAATGYAIKSFAKTVTEFFEK